MASMLDLANRMASCLSLPVDGEGHARQPLEPFCGDSRCGHAGGPRGCDRPSEPCVDRVGGAKDGATKHFTPLLRTRIARLRPRHREMPLERQWTVIPDGESGCGTYGE